MLLASLHIKSKGVRYPTIMLRFIVSRTFTFSPCYPILFQFSALFMFSHFSVRGRKEEAITPLRYYPTMISGFRYAHAPFLCIIIPCGFLSQTSINLHLRHSLFLVGADAFCTYLTLPLATSSHVADIMAVALYSSCD